MAFSSILLSLLERITFIVKHSFVSKKTEGKKT